MPTWNVIAAFSEELVCKCTDTLILGLNFWHRSFLTTIMVDHYPVFVILDFRTTTSLDSRPLSIEKDGLVYTFFACVNCPGFPHKKSDLCNLSNCAYKATKIKQASKSSR